MYGPAAAEPRWRQDGRQRHSSFLFISRWRTFCSIASREAFHMKRVILMSICIGAVAITGACGRRDTSQPEKKNIVDLATHPVPAGSIAPVSVIGCLSASGDRFVLTHGDKNSSKTFAYQLVNADEQLRNLVGKEVRVTGE